jgi:hypothetical protein
VFVSTVEVRISDVIYNITVLHSFACPQGSGKIEVLWLSINFVLINEVSHLCISVVFNISQDSVTSIGCGLHVSGFIVLFPTRAREFSKMCKPALQTTHSHSVSTEDFFAGGEVAVA